MPLIAHECVLYVIFVTSNIVLRHPKCDASKNVSTPTISEFYESLRASWILRDGSNGAICFVIRDLENKFWIFNRNYNFVIEITILSFFQKLEFLGSYNISNKIIKQVNHVKCSSFYCERVSSGLNNMYNSITSYINPGILNALQMHPWL